MVVGHILTGTAQTLDLVLSRQDMQDGILQARNRGAEQQNPQPHTHLQSSIGLCDVLQDLFN